MPDIVFKPVPAQDIPDAFEIEQLGFPPDEAAELNTLSDRQYAAPDLFLGAYIGPDLIGYVCATLTPSSTLTHSSMSTHVPGAPYAAIHSVCVHPNHRKHGIALSLLKAYLARLSDIPAIDGARLITHDHLIPFYQKAAFHLVGPSGVVHGSSKWYEMRVDFGGVSGVEALRRKGDGQAGGGVANAVEDGGQTPTPTPAVGGGAEGAVENYDEKAGETGEEEEDEGEVRNTGKKWTAFGGKVDSLIDRDGLNAAGLYCPQAGCRCLLLRPGAGKWVRPTDKDFSLPPLPHPIGKSPPSPSPVSGYWSVPSPLSFENIGFSRNAAHPSPAPASSAPQAAIKYLTCADCDHGPLGWHDTEGRDLGTEVAAENEGEFGKVRSGREFLLAAERVRYKV